MKRKIKSDDILIIILCVATFLIFVLPNIMNLIRK